MQASPIELGIVAGEAADAEAADAEAADAEEPGSSNRLGAHIPAPPPPRAAFGSAGPRGAAVDDGGDARFINGLPTLMISDGGERESWVWRVAITSRVVVLPRPRGEAKAAGAWSARLVRRFSVTEAEAPEQHRRESTFQRPASA